MLQLLITSFRHLEFKRNFLRIKRMVLIGGPDDGLICPWQSRFGNPFVWCDFFIQSCIDQMHIDIILTIQVWLSFCMMWGFFLHFLHKSIIPQ